MPRQIRLNAFDMNCVGHIQHGNAFEDYWSGFSMPIGQIGQRVAALSAELRAEVERHVRSGYLAGLPDGPRSFAIIVRVVRGTVPAGG